jgi:hypothetical protein
VNRKLELVVLVLMLAIVPIRALATVTTGFCAMNAASSAILEGEHGGHHGDEAAPHGNDKHDGCNACVEHCASGAIVSLPGLVLPPLSGAARILSGEAFAGSHIPEHLDPPPLAA